MIGLPDQIAAGPFLLASRARTPCRSFTAATASSRRALSHPRGRLMRGERCVQSTSRSRTLLHTTTAPAGVAPDRHVWMRGSNNRAVLEVSTPSQPWNIMVLPA